MGLQLVRITKESAYGVFPTSGISSANQANIFLPMGDAMTVRATPQYWQIRDSGQGNRLIRSSVGRKVVGGSLSTYLYPSQAPLMLSIAAGLVGTNPCYDLPSFAIDHAIYEDTDCAVTYDRYTGNKVTKATISCDDSAQGCLLSFKADVVGSVRTAITVTEFPTASLSAYPADDPYLIYNAAELTGYLFIGSNRHFFKSFSISFDNVVKPFGGETRFNKLVKYFGRTVSFTADLLYQGKGDRNLYEAGTKQAVKVLLDNGVNTCLVDFGTVNNIDSVTDKFPLDDYFMQTISFTALVDPTVGTPTDVTLATT